MCIVIHRPKQTGFGRFTFFLRHHFRASKLDTASKDRHERHRLLKKHFSGTPLLLPISGKAGCKIIS
ncbi:hypothetical protein J8V12_20175 [Photorhabdus thracensis]|nr:hypothetical protein [Photorhabdus thracensis]